MVREEKTGSSFTSGPLLLRIIDHYHLCDLEWDKKKQWLQLESQRRGISHHFISIWTAGSIKSRWSGYCVNSASILLGLPPVHPAVTKQRRHEWTLFTPQYSPLRTYWNSPWVQARRSYGGFHLQISSLIYCYQLCCPSGEKKTKKNQQ